MEDAKPAHHLKFQLLPDQMLERNATDLHATVDSLAEMDHATAAQLVRNLIHQRLLVQNKDVTQDLFFKQTVPASDAKTTPSQF